MFLIFSAAPAMLMSRLFPLHVFLLVTVMFVSSVAAAAEEYVYDAVHSSVSFQARHLDISWIHGRFNEVDGQFSIDR